MLPGRSAAQAEVLGLNPYNENSPPERRAIFTIIFPRRETYQTCEPRGLLPSVSKAPFFSHSTPVRPKGGQSGVQGFSPAKIARLNGELFSQSFSPAGKPTRPASREARCRAATLGHMPNGIAQLLPAPLDGQSGVQDFSPAKIARLNGELFSQSFSPAGKPTRPASREARCRVAALGHMPKTVSPNSCPPLWAGSPGCRGTAPAHLRMALYFSAQVACTLSMAF